MSDETNPLEDAIEHAMDAFVYAPIGLVFDGPALFPKLVQSGRNQVKAARMMGQMAVQMGQGEATKRVSKAHDQFRDSLATLGLVPQETGDGGAPSTAAATATKAAPKKKKATSKKATSTKAAPKKATSKKARSKKAATKRASAPSRVSVGELAIPDYDSLSASQVVKRLRSLASAELDQVKAYESSTRARKTILNRITQLQKD